METAMIFFRVTYSTELLVENPQISLNHIVDGLARNSHVFVSENS